MVRVVVEPEREERPVEMHELTHTIEVHGLPVGRQSHRLAFVPVVGEPEPLRDGRVEDAKRMRKQHTIKHLEPVAMTDREHRAREVAEAVDRQNRSMLERRHEKSAGGVGTVMLHVVELGSQRAALDAERVGERVRRVSDLSLVREALADVADTRPVPERPPELRTEVGARIAPDRDVVDVRRLQACLGKAPPRRQGREARDMLDPIEPLFLGSGDELAVHHQCSGGIAVIRVQAKDCGHGEPS